MAVFNEIYLSQTISDNRLSADFYNPKYIKSLNKSFEWVKIGRILNKCQYGISIKMNESGIGYKIVRINELNNCFIDEIKKFANISESEYNLFELKFNDVLFNRTNSFDFVGRTSIVKDIESAVFASYLIRLVPNQDFILPEFLTLFLNTNYGIGQIKRRAMQSINQSNVSASEVKQILIPLVDLPTQKRFAAILNESYRLKTESKSLFQQAQSLLEKELGLDKIKFASINHYQSSFNSTVFFNRFDSEYYSPKYSQIKDLIKNYKFGFESFLQKIINVSPNINPSSTPAEEFNYIELSNINSHLGIVEGSTKVFGSTAPSRAQREVKTGDVIASSVVGSIDKSALITELENKFLASSGFFHLRSNEYSPQYLLVLMQSKLMTEQLNQEATGGILSAVPNDKLKFIVVPNIPKKLQDEISDLVLKSHLAYRESKRLLSSAIKQVEDLIETEAAKNN